MKGYFSLVLHTHMPYVRKNGAFPVGEDWLYQAMSETYLPLLGMLAQLEYEGAGPCLALTMTPVLCEQLADPYIQERFVTYLKTMQDHAADDIKDFVYFNDESRKALAETHREEFRRKLMAFLAIDGDLLAAFASFEEQGLIEIIASCATHAFLPAQRSVESAREQVRLGVESHRGRFGAQPRGFWIPECAYTGGLEELLESEGIQYFIVDSSALDGRPAGRPNLVGKSNVVALARSDRAHANAWDELSGYPTDGRYLDSTKYYHSSGLHYWRVTGPGVDIENKEPYEPKNARIRAFEHSEHFIGDVIREAESITAAGGRFERDGETVSWVDPPLVLASYDTEFLGHGWKEGIYWLELTLRSLSAGESVRLTTPSRFLADNLERLRSGLLSTTWGTDRDHSTWVNQETAWMWEEIYSAQERLRGLMAGGPPHAGASIETRALEQAVREVLLLESSDWPYMVAKNRARGYADERFRAHIERFTTLADAIEKGKLGDITQELGEIEETDNIFAELDLSGMQKGV